MKQLPIVGEVEPKEVTLHPQRRPHVEPFGVMHEEEENPKVT